jgi:hypothetical protein
MFRVLTRLVLALALIVTTRHIAAAQAESTFPLSFETLFPASQPGPATATPILTPTLVAQIPPPVGIAAPAAASPACVPPIDPYKNYGCLDAYLGDDVLTRLWRYYGLEMGQAGPPSDPNAPPGRRDGWPATPQTTPPMPFTEWPYGGTTPFGVTRTGSADSPLMVAIGNTGLGQWMNETGIQVYGWVDPGVNISSAHRQPAGNAPAAYIYTPNTLQLDQAVIYIDRFPDTVQKDHIDWGMRLSAIYGENYRFTTAYGVASYQFLQKNNIYGYDFPMVYGELYIPQVAEGLMLRLGRFISLPDIEAQLAPNNYMYTHSMTYTFDNYTNEGLQASLVVTPQLMVQFGITTGTEAPPWHYGTAIPNPFPNPLFPGNTMKVDPGDQISYTGCLRFTWNEGNDNIYPCLDALNSGRWGYNNLQWHGLTYYHKFNDNWHLSFEAYDLWQNKVPNILNPTVQTIVANGGTPFAHLPFNSPNMAQCGNPTALDCRATAIGTTAYLNYSPDPLNNFSFRPEFYDDEQGQRTGTRTRYVDFGFGWQHWLSPQIEFRPEITYYRSLNANAFNGSPSKGIAPDRSNLLVGSMDMIFHF